MKYSTMKQFDDYQKDQLTINIAKANIFGFLIIIPVVILYILPFYFIWREKIINHNLKDILGDQLPDGMAAGALTAIIVIAVGIVLHELIHGIIWAKFAENGFKSIRFGVIWKVLTPYCHCKEPLKVKHYILGAIAPAIVLGLIPALIAIIIGSTELLVAGMFFTVAGAGDFMVIHLLRKERKDDYVQDHPSEAGCYVYRKPANN
jgi:hypothetical protein